MGPKQRGVCSPDPLVLPTTPNAPRLVDEFAITAGIVKDPDRVEIVIAAGIAIAIVRARPSSARSCAIPTVLYDPDRNHGNHSAVRCAAAARRGRRPERRSAAQPPSAHTSSPLRAHTCSPSIMIEMINIPIP